VLTQRWPGELKVFPSVNWFDDTSDGVDKACNHPFDVEVLNKLAGSGQLLPSVTLKHILPMLMTTNLDPSAGMANGTRIVVPSWTVRLGEGPL